jgi:hypothetical protein
MWHEVPQEYKRWGFPWALCHEDVEESAIDLGTRWSLVVRFRPLPLYPAETACPGTLVIRGRIRLTALWMLQSVKTRKSCTAGKWTRDIEPIALRCTDRAISPPFSRIVSLSFSFALTRCSMGPPLWSRGQSSWLHNRDVLCFLWGTNWIYICYVEESRPPLWSSGQSSWLHNGDVLCFLWGTNCICICYVEESRQRLWASGQSSWLHNKDVLCFLWGTNCICICYAEESRQPLWSSGQTSWLQFQRSRVRFPALPDFLRSSGPGRGSTQPCEYNSGATWKK